MMSLKAFHLLFIWLCTLLSLSVGVWEILAWRDRSDGSALVLGVLFCALGPLLLYYGLRFRRDWTKKGLPS